MGWYLIVMVPSLLSVICGRAVLPEGMRTSPAIDNGLVSDLNKNVLWASGCTV